MEKALAEFTAPKPKATYMWGTADGRMHVSEER